MRGEREGGEGCNVAKEGRAHLYIGKKIKIYIIMLLIYTCHYNIYWYQLEEWKKITEARYYQSEGIYQSQTSEIIKFWWTERYSY